jgi:hypothetical protein
LAYPTLASTTSKNWKRTFKAEAAVRSR